MEHQEEILSKEKLLQKAFEAAQIGVWYWNMETDELIVNDAFSKLVGVNTTNDKPYTIQDFVSACHFEDRNALSEKIINCNANSPKQFEIKLRLKQTNNKWTLAQISGEIAETDPHGSPTALTGVLTNISELRESKDSLRYRYEIEKLVSEISYDFVGIQMNDLDKIIDQSLKKIGHFMKVDRCYVFQFRQHNIIMDNTHEWCAEGIGEQMDNLQNMPSSLFPWWMKKLNKLEHIYIHNVEDLPKGATAEKETLQSQQIISLLVVPIHYQKKLLGYIGFDSVREEKEWQESDIHLISTVAHTMASAFNANIHQNAILRAKEKAEEGDRIKSAFLATINHELRTPLHHILGFSDLIRMNKIPESEIANFAHKIHNSGKILLDLIEDILSLALADDSIVKLRKESFKGSELFGQQRLLLEEMLLTSNKERKIKLKYKTSASFTKHQFIADKNKIEQVLVNLLKNAVKFTEAGSIELIAEIKNNTMIFRIKDTGIGIPQHQQELIFDFFRQIDDTSTRLYSGVGVGLSIAKRITKILGGQLSVVSIPKKGSTFTFEVPIEISGNLEDKLQKKDELIDIESIPSKNR